MKNTVKYFLLILLGTFIFSSCSKDYGNANKYLTDNVAVSGYDVVAYHTDQKAIKGSSNYKVTHEGADYYFNTQEHLNLFKADQDKYLPAYGGWCGYAIANRSKRMPPNPEQWIIQDGKLILFFDNLITKIRGGLLNKWQEDPKNHRIKADKNWKLMSNSK